MLEARDFFDNQALVTGEQYPLEKTLAVFHAGEALFHTGWFIESMATQVLRHPECPG
jgi:hypothetical protein